MHIYFLILKIAADFIVKREESVYSQLVLGLASLGGSVPLHEQENISVKSFSVSSR